MSKNNEIKHREFSLSSIATDNTTSILLLVVMILVFGVFSYRSLPKESFPEIIFPNILVTTVYFGNPAKDMENLVTRPLEKEINGITGIKKLNSTSIQDFSVLNIEFETDIEIQDALRQVKDAVDKASSELPDDLTEDPEVEDINLAEFPIQTINLSGDFSGDELKHFAEYLQDEIEELREVSAVELKGSLEREIQVDVDMIKMQGLQIAFDDIQNAIAGENVSLSGGEIKKNGFRRSVIVNGEFKDVSEIDNLIIKSEDGKTVFLRDIGKSTYGYKEKTSIARADADPVISLDVIKRKGENLIEASRKVREILKQSQKDGILPETLNVSIFNDQSIATELSVSNLENSIISGVILVVFVLLFFLGIRNASFVGMAIPLSMLLGITILSLMGITLNMVVLFSLVLALGLLVDNALVIVENIFRYRQEGYNAADASKFGAGEVAWPIIASTATTLAAFVPLAFWPGVMGSFMKFLPITLMIVLTSSLFVGLVINPVLAKRFMIVERVLTSSEKKRKRKNTLIFSSLFFAIAALLFFVDFVVIADEEHDPLIFSSANMALIIAIFNLVNFFFFRPASAYFQNTFLPKLENSYDKFINRALKGFMPIGVFAGTLVLMVLAILLLLAKSPKVEFFPEAEPLYVNAFVELPNGTDIEETDKLIRKLEQKVIDVVSAYGDVPEAVLTQIGENTADPSEPPQPGSSPHKARITVPFIPSDQRGDVSTFEIMDKIREGLGKAPGVEIVIDKNSEGPPTGKPVNIEITGEDIDKLVLLADDMKNFIRQKNIAGIEELKSDVKMNKPELIVNLDRESARRYEISTYQIANTIRTALFGREVSKFKEGEDEYPIQLRLDEKYRNNIEDLLSQKVTFRSQASGQIVQVPLSVVANIEYSRSYSSIARKDLDRMVTLYSNVIQGYIAQDVVNEIKGALANYEMPAGYRYEFTGEQEEMAENMAFLTSAFTVAVCAIFIILVTQFNSLITPFIIILSVLFSTIGVFLGYILTNMNIVLIMSGIGIISLAGVVVNNAIVLVDYINLLIDRRKDKLGIDDLYDLKREDVKQAIIKAGATRLRPVLLTAITTVLGLIPLAIGFNFNFFTLLSRWDPQYFLGGDNTAFWGPLAWTVIYGLIFATFLTLVVVPVMYWLAYRMLYALRKRKKRGIIA